MSQTLFNPDWPQLLSDPYAALGLSVTADDRRVLKRYRTVARLLHPDTYINAEPETRERASQIFARLINPSYQKLGQERGRAENLAVLRFRVRRMSREESLNPQSATAQQLMQTPTAEVDIFYEQAVAQLADTQYAQLDHFERITFELAELNLVYLRLKMGEPIIREKRNGLVAASTIRPVQVASPSVVESETPTITVNYAERHFARAREYMSASNWNLAVRELRDAIRIDPNRSEYHSHLGKTYLMQDLPIMAKVHFRQALKLNPRDALALQYAKRMGIQHEEPPTAARSSRGSGGGGFFGLFARRR